MKDLVIAIVLVIVFSLAIFYIVREKKRGAKCVGCPYAKECSKNKCDNE